MSLQCSRFLIKSVNEMKASKEPKGSVKYLLDPPVQKLPFDSWAAATPEQLSDMFKDRARRQALRLQERFAAEQATGKSFTDATNATAIYGYKAAGCHSAYITISRNLGALNDFVKPKDIHIYHALLNLYELTALVQIKDDLADWIGIVTPGLADSLMDQIHVLLDKIRPDAVGLVDSMGFDDEQLKSTLGRYDGNVYGAFVHSLARFLLFLESPTVHLHLILSRPFLQPTVSSPSTLLSCSFLCSFRGHLRRSKAESFEPIPENGWLGISFPGA